MKKIKIRPKNEFYSRLLTVSEALDHGEKVDPLRGEFFESLEAVRNVLTDKRLELWRLIRDRTPASITELAKLAKLAKRDFKNVHSDVSMLVTVGLVEIRREKGKRGDTQRPVSLVDTLLLDVA